MIAEPLTIAYLAIGAYHALQNTNGFPAEGEVEYIDNVIKYAELLDKLAPDVCDGCYPYEVVEPFGEEIGTALLNGDVCNPLQIAEQLIESMQI